jgi:hypothetical protein
MLNKKKQHRMKREIALFFMPKMISFRLKYLFEVLNDRELFIVMLQENLLMMSKSFNLKLKIRVLRNNIVIQYPYKNTKQIVFL